MPVDFFAAHCSPHAAFDSVPAAWISVRSFTRFDRRRHLTPLSFGMTARGDCASLRLPGPMKISRVSFFVAVLFSVVP